MIRGRRPKPTHLKIVTGNPGKRPLPENELRPPMRNSLPKPPPHLLPEAVKEWKRLARSVTLLGLVSELDLGAFAAYCQAYGRWAQAERHLAALAVQDPSGRAGLLVRTKAGGVTANPLVWVARNAANDMVRYAAEFGFTPSSRTRITASAPIHRNHLADSSADEFFDD
jgi:P27 family predicted phage terminase small subunit